GRLCGTRRAAAGGRGEPVRTWSAAGCVGRDAGPPVPPGERGRPRRRPTSRRQSSPDLRSCPPYLSSTTTTPEANDRFYEEMFRPYFRRIGGRSYRLRAVAVEPQSPQ